VAVVDFPHRREAPDDMGNFDINQVRRMKLLAGGK